MKGPVEPVHRSVPETIQEVIELTGFLCFLFRSTPNIIYGGECFWRVPLEVPLGHQEKGYHRKGSPRKVSFPRKHPAA